MSKQLGNSPDALNLINVYGADSVRVGLMLSSAAGNDLLFDENSIHLLFKKYQIIIFYFNKL